MIGSKETVMTVTNEKVISLTYDLRIDDKDGKLVESVTNDAPLTFIFGTGKLLPKFEDNLKGLNVGEEFEFSLNSTEAYGDFNEDAVVNVPISIFQVNGQIDDNLLKVGNSIPMMDKSGNRLSGIVLEINDNDVKMDFNHPLAGNELFFKGKVTEVREATEDELAQGLNDGCGCGGGCSCEDGHC